MHYYLKSWFESRCITDTVCNVYCLTMGCVSVQATELSLSSFDQFYQVHEILDNGCNYTKLLATKFRIKKKMKTKSILALHKFLVSKTATYIYIFKKKKNSKFIISNNKEVYLSIRYEYIELLCTNNSAIRTIKCWHWQLYNIR